jgi:putative DNA primase/helicase
VSAPAPNPLWTPLPFAPEGSPDPISEHPLYGRPVGLYSYRTAADQLAGYVCQFATQRLPLTWCRNCESEDWRWERPLGPNPLYDLPNILAQPDREVIIFCSERSCSAGNILLPDFLCTTWMGGSAGSVRKADWSQLQSRPNVIIWPDATPDGIRAANAVAAILPDAIAINPPADWSAATTPDLARALIDNYTPERALTHIKVQKQLKLDAVEEARRAQELVEPPPSEPESPPEDEPTDRTPTGQWPFRFLGHNDGLYFYLPKATNQVRALDAKSHSKASLLELGRASFWKDAFPPSPESKSTSPVDWTAAADSLLAISQRRLFSPQLLRGRGCWIDGSTKGDGPKSNRVIFHTGQEIVCDGVSQPIDDFDTRFVYQQGDHVKADTVPPAPPQQARRLLEICELLSFATPMHGRLLAGWCMCANVCGALDWRPHVWLTGSAGLGKSFIISNIIMPTLGGFVLQPQGHSTEAGIRQSIKSDAMPIVFDEAESEDDRGTARMKSILDLARQSSSETGGRIYKGTVNGSAMAFNIRSSFCFSSIGVATSSKADMDRITVLELQHGPNRHEGFTRLKSAISDALATPDFFAGIRARAINQALQIKTNAGTFSDVLTVRLGDRRAADQLGAMLAGAFALTSASLVTKEFVTSWVDEQDWGSFLPSAVDKDETQALSRLLDAPIRMDLDGDRSYTTSVGSLIQRYYDPATGGNERDACRERLMLIGIRANDRSIDVSNSHVELAKIFSDTSWAKKWGHQLGRIRGSVKSQGTRFGVSVHRSVNIPLSEIGPDLVGLGI